jgi:hypothetical protein
MRNSCFKTACVALLLVLGVSAGFGWGTLTHVYFANNLGVMVGPRNQNEIYGAVLPDMFGYDFSPSGLTADYMFHTQADVYWGLYGSAMSPYAKAAFYGVFTHNNIDDKVRGADWYAHGVYPMSEEGWVIRQGASLASKPEIATYVMGKLDGQKLPDGTPVSSVFLPVVGHTLIETAVDILVRRCEDPLAGGRLILAARNRTNDVPQVLAALFGNPSGHPTPQEVLDGEGAFREQMLGFGQLFLLPEQLLIQEISKQTADVAQKFLQGALGVTNPPSFDPAKIAEFIRIAIAQVKPVYHRELMATLCSVRNNMAKYGPQDYPVFALWKDGTGEDELAEFNIPAENPAEFALDQNYPNPFNPTTNIEYAVPTDSRVTLNIYNSLGQEVATLVDDNMTAGRYVVTWDAKGIAGGTYFYRMQAGNTVLTRKMVLLK